MRSLRKQIEKRIHAKTESSSTGRTEKEKPTKQAENQESVLEPSEKTVKILKDKDVRLSKMKTEKSSLDLVMWVNWQG